MADGNLSTHVARIFYFFKRPDELLRKMARHPQLCCLFVTILSSFILDYVCSNTKSKPVLLPPRPPPFLFPPPGPVLDAPLGSLGSLIQMLHKEDIVLVLYYAHWCTKSQDARAEYTKAAQYLKGQVQFAAVNCWWPEGECRKRYKFLMFPVLMAYHTKLDGFRFSGPFRAEHIIKFAENLMHPLSIVHSQRDALRLMAQHDTVVFGYFNLSSADQVGSYQQFYYASMRIVEHDSLQPMGIATVTHADVAKGLGMNNQEDIIMHRISNDSQVVYPYAGNITSSNIVRWALRNKGQEIVKRLTPEGVKSKALATDILKGPSFILFHVEDPLFNTEMALKMVKDLALLYQNCKVHPMFQEARSALLDLAQAEIQRYQELTRTCSQLKRDNAREQQQLEHLVDASSCCVTTVVPTDAYTTDRRICSVCCPSTNPGTRSECCNTVSQNLTRERVAYINGNNTNKIRGPPPLDCRNVQLNYSDVGKISVCCYHAAASQGGVHNSQCVSTGRGDFYSKSGTVGDDNSCYSLRQNENSGKVTGHQDGERRMTDRYVRHHLENIPRRLCDRLVLQRQQRVAPTVPPSSLKLDPDMGRFTTEGATSPWPDYFSALPCRRGANRSLSFYSMDQQNHWMFADVLGLKNMERNGLLHPAAVIVDIQNDQHFILKENITVLNTMSFIANFEQGRLKRHQNSHSFPVHASCSQKDSICVRELDTQSFDSVVMDDSKDVVLLIYAHWCAFCHTFSHTFLAAANYFPPSNITFARINGDTNDLPWQFSFTSYPAVVFFPANMKADSVVFSPLLHRTLPDLVRFVLRHAQPEVRLKQATHFCSRDCVLRNTQRSRALLHKLSGRAARLQAKLREYAGIKGVEEGLKVVADSSAGESRLRDREAVNGPYSDSRAEASKDLLYTNKNKPGSKSKVVYKKGGYVKNRGEQLNIEGSSVTGKGFYTYLSINYLQLRLLNTRKEMDLVKKILHVFRSSKGEPLRKQELVQLLHLKNRSQGVL